MAQWRNADICPPALRRRNFIGLLGGAAAAWPIGARAQQKAVIGVVDSTTAVSRAPFIAAFRRGLGETGYVEGQNVVIEYRWAEGHFDRLPALATDLVSRHVDVIFTSGGNPSAIAAKSATSTIPIVFEAGGDPVALGLVASLARPGSNVTGISILAGELTAKRVELICELVPWVDAIAVLTNPTNRAEEAVVRDAQQASQAKALRLHVIKASSDSEINVAFSTIAELHTGALVVSSDPFFTSRREQLVALAARHAVPAIYWIRDFAAAGGLISYGPSLAGAYREAGIYAGRILKVEKPADLPVQQPTKFELVINLRTAKALGLIVPPTLMARADEVID